MVFNGTDWTVVISTASALGVKLVADWKVFKKNDPKLADGISNEAAKVLNAGEKGLEELLHSPKVAELQLHLTNVESTLHDAQLANLAATTLHSFSTKLDGMTDDEKSTAVLNVVTEAKKMGINVTTNQVLRALNDAQKVADAFEQSELFKTTQRIVQVKKAVAATSTAPTQSVPDQQTQPAPAPVVDGQPSAPAVS